MSLRPLLFVLAFVGACSRPQAQADGPRVDVSLPPAASSDPTASTTTAPAPTPTAPAGSSAAEGTATTGARCSRDEDCRAHSFYCDSCQCLALGKDQPAPPCHGKQVNCLLDPCAHRKAVCDRGKCAMGDAR